MEGIVTICDRFKQLLPEAKAVDCTKIAKVTRGAFALKPMPGNPRVQVVAAECLSLAGADGLIALRWALKRKALQTNSSLTADELPARRRAKAAVIKAIGSFADPKTLPLLLECLQENSLETIKASCSALERFRDLRLSRRKPVVKQVIKRYTALVMQEYPGIGSSRQKRVGRAAGAMDWTAVKMPINRTIQVLTGQRLYTAKSWREWFRAHEKDKEWPEGRFTEENPWGGIESRGGTKPPR